MSSAVAAVLLCLASAACGDRGGDVVRVDPEDLAPVPDAVLKDLPWEAAFDDAERDRTVAGVLLTPDLSGADAAGPFLPFPGARIELFVPRPDGRPPFTKVAETVSGPDGKFSLGLAPPATFLLRASHAGYVTTNGGMGIVGRGVITLEPGVSHPFGIQKARTLTGKVVDRAGRPVANALLRADSIMFSQEMRTAADGTFSLEAPADAVALHVADPSWDVVHEMVEYDPDAPPVPVQLVTTATDPLSGFVASTDDNRPIAGAIVTWLDDPTRTTRTDDAGRFALKVPRTGRLSVFAGGHAWRTYEVRRAGEMELRLAPTRTLLAHVVDRSGSPVAGARLYAVALSVQGVLERAPGPSTGADGRARFSWIPRVPRGQSRQVLVFAYHRKLGVSAAFVVPLTGALPSDVTLTLPGTRKVTGVALDSAGQPVPDLDVTAEWALPGMDGVTVQALALPTQWREATDASGRFSVPCAPLSADVSISVTRYGTRLTQIVPANEEGGVPLTFQFALGGTVRGRVTTSAGEDPSPSDGPRGTVRLRLLDVPGVTLDRAVGIGPGGTFVGEDLPPGRYQLIASVPGYDLDGGGEARPGDPDATLIVERSGRIDVEILGWDAAERAVGVRENALTCYIDDLVRPSMPPHRFVVPGPALGTSAATPRTVTAPAMAPGRYRVRVECGAWRGETSELTVGDGEAVRAVVTLSETLRVTGVLQLQDGTPARNEAVLFARIESVAAAPAFVQGMSDAGGALDVSGFWPGTWEARVSSHGRAPLVARITLPTTGAVTLRLPPSSDLTVFVRTAEGAGIASAEVSLQDEKGAEAYAWQDGVAQVLSKFRAGDDGQVRIRGVAVGKYQVSASVGGARRLGPVPVEVVAGSPATAVIQ